MAFLIGYLVWPAEPLRDRLDLLQVGMTQVEVENILGAPDVSTQWRDMVVLTFQTSGNSCSDACTSPCSMALRMRVTSFIGCPLVNRT